MVVVVVVVVAVVAVVVTVGVVVQTLNCARLSPGHTG